MGLLEVRDVTIERDGLPIVRGATLDVDAGAVTVLLGVNGAGKTTLLEGISGVIDLAAGSVSLGGTRISRRQPYVRSRLGLAHVEQGRTVFRDLTVRQNLLVVAGERPVAEAFDLFPELASREHVAGGLLSGGEQQMLVVARAFLRRPKVLLLDELSLGLAPMVIQRLMTAVSELAASGMGILLVEQFAALALAVSTRAYVIRGGGIVYDGTADHLRASPRLLERLYLGDSSPDPIGAE